MTKEIIYKGAYLSEPLHNVPGIPNGKRMWVLLIWQSGFQSYRLFSDLKFWAQKQAIKQGFNKKSLTK